MKISSALAVAAFSLSFGFWGNVVQAQVVNAKAVTEPYFNLSYQCNVRVPDPARPSSIIEHRVSGITPLHQCTDTWDGSEVFRTNGCGLSSTVSVRVTDEVAVHMILHVQRSEYASLLTIRQAFAGVTKRYDNRVVGGVYGEQYQVAPSLFARIGGNFYPVGDTISNDYRTISAGCVFNIGHNN